MLTEQEFKKEFAVLIAHGEIPIRAADKVFTPYGMNVQFLSWIANNWIIDNEVKALIEQEKNRQPTKEELLGIARIRALKAPDNEAHKYLRVIADVLGITGKPDDGKSEGSLDELAAMVNGPTKTETTA